MNIKHFSIAVSITLCVHTYAQTLNFNLDNVQHIGSSLDENIREIALCPDGDLVLTGYPAPALTELQAQYGSLVHVIGSGAANVNTVRAGFAVPNQNTFIIKLSGDTRTIRWITIIGGSEFDRGYGIEVDPNGIIYLAGQTASLDFPTTPGALDPTNNGGNPKDTTSGYPHHGIDVDMFVLKLSPDGQTLLASTYLGSGADDGCRGGLELDDQGNVYLAGFTSVDYTQQWNRNGSFIPMDDFLADAINNPNKLDTLYPALNNWAAATVVKLNNDLDQVLWCRYLGSNDDLASTSVEVIAGLSIHNDQIYANGIVRGPGAFVSDASTYSHGPTGIGDIYVAKLDLNGNYLNGHYIQGNAADDAKRRGVTDQNGNYFVLAQSTSTDLGGVATNAAFKGHLIKFDSNLQQQWIRSMPTTPSLESSNHGPVIDHNGNIYIAGLIQEQLTAPDISVNAIDNSYNTGNTNSPWFWNGQDAYMRVYDQNGVNLYTTYLGGNDEDKPRFITLDKFDNPIIGINSNSTDFPDVNPAMQHGNLGQKDLHITRLVNPACRIIETNPLTQGACNPSTDQFTQDIQVITANTSGDLNFNGSLFAGINDCDTVTLILPATGTSVDLSSFDVNDTVCSLNVTGAFTAPSSCLATGTVNNEDQAVIISPNPSSNKVRIVTRDNELLKVCVYSTHGKVLLRSAIHSGEEINITTFPLGVYLIHVVSNSITKSLRLIRN